MTNQPYQPERGDLCWLDFSPHAGIEQAGRRPAIVLSPRIFNVATGLAFVCPITSKLKHGSFDVPMPGGSGISGVVLCDNLRSFDWISRGMKFHAKAPMQLLEDVLARIAPILNL